MWVLTVASLRTSVSAISLFSGGDQSRTSISRGVSWSGRLGSEAGAGSPAGVGGVCSRTAVTSRRLDGGVEVGVAGDRRPDRLFDFLGGSVGGRLALRRRSAGNRNSSSAVSTRTCVSGSAAAGRFGALEAGHSQVHQHDVGPVVTAVGRGRDVDVALSGRAASPVRRGLLCRLRSGRGSSSGTLDPSAPASPRRGRAGRHRAPGALNALPQSLQSRATAHPVARWGGRGSVVNRQLCALGLVVKGRPSCTRCVPRDVGQRFLRPAVKREARSAARPGRAPRSAA